MDTIQLHIAKKTRRRGLARALGEKHEMTSGDPTIGDAGGDLLILDNSTYQRNGPAAIEAFKQPEGRVAFPVLLLVPSDWMSHLDQETWDQVDDVLEMPIRLPELTGRLQVLLQLHRSSAEAHRRTRFVKEKTRQAARYKKLFDSLHCGLLLLSDGEIEEVNGRAETLFGASSKQLKGQSLGTLSSPDQPGGEAPTQKSKDLLRAVEGGEARPDWRFERVGGGSFEGQLVADSVTIGGKTFVQILIYESSSLRSLPKQRV